MRPTTQLASPRHTTSIFNDAILRSVTASKRAYCSDRCDVGHIHGHGHTQAPAYTYKVFDDVRTGAHTHSWHTGDAARVVAFRGTHDVHDLCRYLDGGMSRFDIRGHSVRIHSSLLRMFAAMEDDLSHHILPPPHCQDVSGPPQAVQMPRGKTVLTFCGHSAGGACAELAAVYYGDVTGDDIEIRCHTFGAPRPGDARFAEWYEENVDESVHAVNEHDIVRHLPLWPFGRYASVPGQIVLPDGTVNPFKAHDLDTYDALIAARVHKGGLP